MNNDPVFISTIIPTIGRPSLSKAAESVLTQQFTSANFEVIIVNDSGRPLPAAEWLTLSCVHLIETNRRNRSIARNAGAAVAKGTYLHFLDDDDWMLPGAFNAFWDASIRSHASWVHGAFTMVDNTEEKIVDIYPDEANNCLINLIAWEWLPLQASIVEVNAFFKVGGFAMLNSLMGGFEDIHLTRQIARYYDFMNTPELVACIRSGDTGSTTNYANMFLQNWASREQSINVPGTFRRLIDSAHNNSQHKSYWHGRVAYYYLGSARRNFRRKLLFSSMSRLVHFITSFLMAGKHIFTKEFWRTMTKPHYPRVWTEVMKSGKDIYTQTEWKWSDPSNIN